jgi:hypothetical protein
MKAAKKTFIGYMKENTHLVALWANIAKNTSPIELFSLCKKVVV